MSRGVRGTSVSFRSRHLGVISVSLRMKRRQEGVVELRCYPH